MFRGSPRRTGSRARRAPRSSAISTIRRRRFALPLKPVGTRYQRRVWEKIAEIPSGRVRSYGEVAKDIRSGPRAVGQACGANYFPLAIPCHRVIASGGIGGFARNDDGFHIAIKRWLLAHEGIRLPA